MARKPALPATINTVGPTPGGSRAKITGDVVHRDPITVTKIDVLQNGVLMELRLCFTDVCNLRTLLENLQGAHADAASALYR